MINSACTSKHFEDLEVLTRILQKSAAATRLWRKKEREGYF